MKIIPGHVLALKLPFANGSQYPTKRPFLVIENNDNKTLELLNISTIKGKERKLLFKSNTKIEKYSPPLDEPSFLKMDELYIIDYFDDLYQSIYKRRDPLDSDEFNRLCDEFYKYKYTNKVTEVRYSKPFVFQENFLKI